MAATCLVMSWMSLPPGGQVHPVQPQEDQARCALLQVLVTHNSTVAPAHLVGGSEARAGSGHLVTVPEPREAYASPHRGVGWLLHCLSSNLQDDSLFSPSVLALAWAEVGPVKPSQRQLQL